MYNASGHIRTFLRRFYDSKFTPNGLILRFSEPPLENGPAAAQVQYYHVSITFPRSTTTYTMMIILLALLAPILNSCNRSENRIKHTSSYDDVRFSSNKNFMLVESAAAASILFVGEKKS